MNVVSEREVLGLFNECDKLNITKIQKWGATNIVVQFATAKERNEALENLPNDIKVRPAGEDRTRPLVKIFLPNVQKSSFGTPSVKGRSQPKYTVIRQSPSPAAISTPTTYRSEHQEKIFVLIIQNAPSIAAIMDLFESTDKAKISEITDWDSDRKAVHFKTTEERDAAFRHLPDDLKCQSPSVNWQIYVSMANGRKDVPLKRAHSETPENDEANPKSKSLEESRYQKRVKLGTQSMVDNGQDGVIGSKEFENVVNSAFFQTSIDKLLQEALSDSQRKFVIVP